MVGMDGYWNIVRKVETNGYLMILYEELGLIIIAISCERLKQTNYG